MTTVIRAVGQPVRHVLVMPENCQCGMCTPVWMRRRGKQTRFSERVTLAEALEREDRAVWPGMVEQHSACLAALLSAAACAARADPGDEIGLPEVGLPVLMFAGELAAVVMPGEVRGQLPGAVLAESLDTLAVASFAAAACLAGLADVIQGSYSLQRTASAGDQYDRPAGRKVAARALFR